MINTENDNDYFTCSLGTSDRRRESRSQWRLTMSFNSNMRLWWLSALCSRYASATHLCVCVCVCVCVRILKEESAALWRERASLKEELGAAKDGSERLQEQVCLRSDCVHNVTPQQRIGNSETVYYVCVGECVCVCM